MILYQETRESMIKLTKTTIRRGSRYKISMQNQYFYMTNKKLEDKMEEKIQFTIARSKSKYSEISLSV